MVPIHTYVSNSDALIQKVAQFTEICGCLLTQQSMTHGTSNSILSHILKKFCVVFSHK